MGSVDRNSNDAGALVYTERVAPRMGSVDRNATRDENGKLTKVAPRMGSVDRNFDSIGQILNGFSRSPHGERG